MIQKTGTMNLGEMFKFVEAEYGSGFNSVQSKLRRDGSFLLKATNKEDNRTYLLGKLVSEGLDLGFRLEGTTTKEYEEVVDVREEDPLHEVDVQLIRMVIEYYRDDESEELLGSFWAREGTGFVVCDNSEGDAYTEFFKKFKTVEMYLGGQDLDYCFDLEQGEDLSYDKAQELAEGKVGFYHEDGCSFPVIEVFVSDDVCKARKIANELNETPFNYGGSGFDIESYNINYHRIFYTFAYEELTVSLMQELIDKMSEYGERVYYPEKAHYMIEKKGESRMENVVKDDLKVEVVLSEGLGYYPIVNGYHCVSITADDANSAENILEVVQDERVYEAILSQAESKDNFGILYHLCGTDGDCQQRREEYFKEHYNINVF